MAKDEYKKLRETVLSKKESAWPKDAKGKKAVFDFAEKYKIFLANAKTERAATKTIVSELAKAGFKPLDKFSKLKPGDKVYLNQKEKSVIAAVIGKKFDRMNMVGSHLDSPRLDLKPNPVFEEGELALLKSHYYGGIKKYQWTNVDFALYGVIFTKDGKKIDLCIGEKEDEPRFIVSDLLPHLDKKQMEKKADEIIEAEQLNVYLGNIPLDDKETKEQVKLNVLKILKDTYGIVEDDFSFAELTLVPAGIPRDIGFDKSLISGYGHDDKSSSYANLAAFLEINNPEITVVAYFSDKEEIGSVGNTGAYSFILADFAEMILQRLSLKLSPNNFLRNSRAISADVSAGYDPAFPEVFEAKNSAYLGNGAVIEKYTGGGGKGGANDASSEYMQFIRKLLEKNKIGYQTGELGKQDIGGGGTIALYLSRYGMDTMDAGPAVLGMHSPREVLSKVDLYECYRLYKVFFLSS
ncbi:MAG: aminopeptidase [archaeon]